MIKKALKAAVIITAAGSSSRMGNGTKKEFLTLNNQSILLLSVEPFIKSSLFSSYIIILPKKEIDTGRTILSSIDIKSEFVYVSGGSTRQESVYNGLLALKTESPDFVLIHDGARPWITTNVIEEVYNMTVLKNAAIPVVPSVNAMKSINSSGIIVKNLNRLFTVSAQTPQGFKYSHILNSHETARSDDSNYIDDAEIYGKYSGNVATVPGDIKNKKITYLSDMNQKKRNR